MKPIVFLLLATVLAFAEIKTYTKTIRQTFSGSQTADDARLYAIKKAEADMAREAGEYIAARTVLKNNQMSGEDITAISAAILKTEVKSEKLFGENGIYGIELTIASTLDTSTVDQQIDKILKSQENLAMNKDLQKQNNDLRDQLARLEAENANAKTQTQKDRVKEEYVELQKQNDDLRDKLARLDKENERAQIETQKERVKKEYAAANVDCAARYAEPTFAICPPIGWTAGEFGGFKYKFLFAPPANDFRSNLNFMEEKTALALTEYVDLSIDTLKKMIKNVKILKRESFSAKNVKGERVVTQSVQYDLDMRQIVYVFDMGKSTKMAISCTALLSEADKTVALCDAALKTFERR
jgi:hypothetical protein